MTLGGGDPDQMTMRRFIDVAATLLVEEFQRTGAYLVDAIDRVNMLGIDPVEETAAPASASGNDQAVSTLMAAMAGVRGAPV